MQTAISLGRRGLGARRARELAVGFGPWSQSGRTLASCSNYAHVASARGEQEEDQSEGRGDLLERREVARALNRYRLGRTDIFTARYNPTAKHFSRVMAIRVAQFHNGSKLLREASSAASSTTVISQDPGASGHFGKAKDIVAAGQSEPKGQKNGKKSVSTKKSVSEKEEGEKKAGTEVSKLGPRAQMVITKTKEILAATWSVVMQFIRNPMIIRSWAHSAWVATKDMAHHTWTGFKLLGVEVQTSLSLVRKRLQGHQLTRRERRQLVRTTADLARVVPFSVFILVPFMEVFLPVALKLFPNMLPSTFKDSYKEEEDMKRKLKIRLEMASFLQEMVSEMEDKAKNSKDVDKGGVAISVDDVRSFMERVRMGKNIDQETVLRVAQLFSDELTTDNMSRSQLVTLCRYMSLVPYGGDEFLRFQLRNKINTLRDDDASIYFEGIDSLTLLELKQACQDRGMRATGLSMSQLRTQLKRWIDLSVDKNVPLSLLILSRVFTLQAATDKDMVENALSEALSQMDADVLQEALVAGAENQDVTADQATLSTLKLEAIQAQNELIQQDIKEKARKQRFLEKLRQNAQAELETQQGTSGSSEVSIEAVREAVEGAVDRLDILHKEPDAKVANKLREHKLGTAEKAEALLEEAYGADEKPPSESSEAVNDDEEFSETLASIKILASDSSLDEEKNILGQILEKQEEIDAAQALDSGRIVKEEEEESSGSSDSGPKESTASQLLKQKVKTMLDQLETDVEAIDEKIGNKLKVLDIDGDGKISNHELRQAIVTALKSQEDYTDEKADRIIERLDLDGDGIIALDELDAILQQLKDEKIRMEGL